MAFAWAIATQPLANGASLPATEDVLARARRVGIATSMDDDALAKVAGYFNWVLRPHSLWRSIER